MPENKISNTKGYQASLKVSPQWTEAYGVTEFLMKQYQVKIAAEIGVARGHHSAHLLEAIPDLRLYSIDPWGYYLKEHKAMYGYHALPDDEKIYQNVVEILKPFGQRSKIIRSTSVRAVDTIKEPLDMIFIDADHTYESVKRDIGLWWDKVKVGGIISGHDYDHSHQPGVKQAVDEYFSNKEITIHKEIGTVWWVQKPLEMLSYIIPSYNAAAFLGEAVESIFRQNLKIPFEVIISDDHSADGTPELIKKLAAEHREIIYFLNEKSLGAPANRNSAISHSRGDYIYMLDHDNILEDNSIPKLIDAINKRGHGAATFQELYFFKGEISNHRGSWLYKYPDNLFTIREFINHPNSPAASNNYMFTRAAYDKAGGYPDRGARENLGFGLRLVATGTPIAIVPDTKYYHRIISSGMWWTEQNKYPELGHLSMASNFREFLNLFDEKTQKLLLSARAEKEADSYIKRDVLKLSTKGWELAGGKEKYRFKFLFLKKYSIRLSGNLKKFISKNKTLILRIKKIFLAKIKNSLINFSLKIKTKTFNFRSNQEQKIFKSIYLFYKNIYLNQINILKKESLAFLLPLWSDYAKRMEEYFFNDFNIDFLNHPVIKTTMFIKPKWENVQLKYLEKKHDEKELKRLLCESKFGHPIITNCKYKTSPNSIHTLNHLSLFEDRTGCILKNKSNIIEWGGGYGNMAKIFLRINPHATYTIIDLPIFTFIQAIYLACIFGKEKINILTERNKEIKNNSINLLPLNEKLINSVNFKRPDIFISTWALSESNDFSQNMVERLKYFNSDYILIGHQIFSETVPFANDIIGKLNGFHILYHEKIPYIKGENFYLFAKQNPK